MNGKIRRVFGCSGSCYFVDDSFERTGALTVICAGQGESSSEIVTGGRKADDSANPIVVDSDSGGQEGDTLGESGSDDAHHGGSPFSLHVKQPQQEHPTNLWANPDR